MPSAGDISVVLKAEKKQYEADLKAAEKQAKDFASNLSKLTVGGGFLSVGGVKDFVSSLGTAGKVAGGVIGVLTALTVAAGAYAIQQSKIVTDQNRLAGALNISIKEVQNLEGAFNRLGSESGTAQSVLSSLDEVLSSAKLGGEAASIQLKALGLNLDDLSNLDTAAALKKILTNVSQLGTTAQREGALLDVFGQQARTLTAAVGDLNDFLGVNVAKTDEATEAYLRLGKAANRLQSEVVQFYTPALDYLASFLDPERYSGQSAPALIEDDRGKKGTQDASAKQIAKQKAANQALVKELEVNSRNLNAIRDPLQQIRYEVQQRHQEASQELRDQLVIQKVEAERLKIQGSINDKQDSIIETLNKELGLKIRINRENKLASDEQKARLIAQEKEKEGADIFASFRKSSAGGAAFFANQDIKRLRDLQNSPDAQTRANSKGIEELIKLRGIERDNATKSALGGTVTPKEAYREAIAKLEADKDLTPEQRATGKKNAAIKLRDEQESFLLSLGKIENPLFTFGRQIEKLDLALQRGEISQNEYEQTKSNLSEKFAPTKLADRIDVSSSQGYDRLAKYFTGFDRQQGDPQKKLVDGVNRSNSILKNLPKDIADALRQERDTI